MLRKPLLQGKSTLTNWLLGEERCLTGPEPGLTRDAIKTRFEFKVGVLASTMLVSSLQCSKSYLCDLPLPHWANSRAKEPASCTRPGGTLRFFQLFFGRGCRCRGRQLSLWTLRAGFGEPSWGSMMSLGALWRRRRWRRGAA